MTEADNLLGAVATDAQRVVDSVERYVAAAQALKDFIQSSQTSGNRPRRGGPQPFPEEDEHIETGTSILDRIRYKYGEEIFLLIFRAVQEGGVVPEFDGNGGLWFSGPQGETTRLLLLLLAGDDYKIDLPYNVFPQYELPCTTLAASVWWATGRLNIDDQTLQQINKLFNRKYNSAADFINELQSNLKLLQYILAPNIGLTVDMMPIVGNEEIIDNPEYKTVNPNDLVFYLDRSEEDASQFAHVAVVYGWASSSNPEHYYDSYEQAIEAGVLDPVLYVVDRGSHEGKPFAFNKYSETKKYEYSFWTATELPPNTSIVVAEQTTVPLYSSPGKNESGKLLLWHRAQVVDQQVLQVLDPNTNTNKSELWWKLANGLWVRSDEVTMVHGNPPDPIP